MQVFEQRPMQLFKYLHNHSLYTMMLFMQFQPAFGTYKNIRIHMVGIKGAGMTAFAEILHSQGAVLSGSDVPEVFFTDSILASLKIPVHTEFSAGNITSEIQLVIHSTAYKADTNPELKKAEELHIPTLNYPQALGALSESMTSAGVCGVHGKTTTTAMAGICVNALHLPATILVGSAVPDFNNRATLILGDKYFVAETCEYQRHFLNFFPSLIVLTSVEPDHLDYFTGYEDIFDAFYSYCSRLPLNGVLVYCKDEPGAAAVAEKLFQNRKDVKYIPYGFTAEGEYKITLRSSADGKQSFSIAGIPEEFSISLPGIHMILDAAAACALAIEIAGIEGIVADAAARKKIIKALSEFKSTKRRSEIIGETNGILFMDDFAHHPSAIRTTLEGLKDFYPARRLIVDFMSHTYSRTKYLLDEFAQSFSDADMVILHKIYASAREKADKKISGKDLFRETQKYHGNVHYFEEVMDAKEFLADSLTRNDLFITMGAGDNWQIAHDLFHYISKQTMRNERNDNT